MSIFGSDSKTDNHKVAPIPARLQKTEKIIILTADKTEDTEFFYPYYRLTEEGYTVDVVTPKGGSFEAKHGLGLKETKAIKDVRPEDYQLLYIPGGKAPEELCKNEDVIRFVQQFAADKSKPIAAICHGPQVLITAGLVQGIQMACWPEIREELEKAGATFVDEALVEDRQFITARKPGDLPRHLFGVMEYLRGEVSTSQRRSAA